MNSEPVYPVPQQPSGSVTPSRLLAILLPDLVTGGLPTQGVTQTPPITVDAPRLFVTVSTSAAPTLEAVQVPLQGAVQPPLTVDPSHVVAVVPADVLPSTPLPYQGLAQLPLLVNASQILAARIAELLPFTLLPPQGLAQAPLRVDPPRIIPITPADAPAPGTGALSVRAAQGRIADLPLVQGPSHLLVITPADLVSAGLVAPGLLQGILAGLIQGAGEGAGPQVSRLFGLETQGGGGGGGAIKRRLLVGVGL